MQRTANLNLGSFKKKQPPASVHRASIPPGGSALKNEKDWGEPQFERAGSAGGGASGAAAAGAPRDGSAERERWGRVRECGGSSGGGGVPHSLSHASRMRRSVSRERSCEGDKAWGASAATGKDTYAHVCSRMLTHAHVCSRMLTYAHACSRMQGVKRGGLSGKTKTRRKARGSRLCRVCRRRRGR